MILVVELSGQGFDIVSVLKIVIVSVGGEKNVFNFEFR